jgi:beta-galactosidase
MTPTPAALAFCLALLASHAHAEQRSLAQGWLFARGDAAGAQQSSFDDAGWRRMVVPHDFAIMDKPDGSPPFDAQAVAGQDSGYLPGGVGWYRHHLDLSAPDAAKVLRIRFEAAYMDAEVWLNGESLGKHAYGYSAFAFDLTGKVRPGRNVIAVRINHVDPSSRWYAGSGLIRPVTLELLDPVHVQPDSVFVSTPQASNERAEVEVRARLANRGKRAVKTEVISKVVAANGAVVAQARRELAVAAGATGDAGQRLTVRQPALWSPSSPNLYKLVQEFGITTMPNNEAPQCLPIPSCGISTRAVSRPSLSIVPR